MGLQKKWASKESTLVIRLDQLDIPTEQKDGNMMIYQEFLLT